MLSTLRTTLRLAVLGNFMRAYADVIPLRVITHNIGVVKVANKTNFTSGEVLCWARKSQIVTELRFLSMPNEMIICLQEVLKNQLDEILSALGPEWAYIDYGRDDEPFTSSDRLLGCV